MSDEPQKLTLLTKSLLLLCALMAGSGSAWATTVLSWSVSGSTESKTSGFTIASNLKSAGSGYRQDNTTSQTYYISLYNTTSALASSTPKSVTLNVKMGGGTANKTLTTPVYACFVDENGDDIANTETEITSTITTAAGDNYQITMPKASITSAYGVKIYHVKTASYNVRFYSFSLDIEEQTATLSSITLSGTYKTSFYQNDEYENDGIVVTANYSDSSTDDVTTSASFSGYDMSTIGTQTVIVSYTNGGVTKTANYSITVSVRPKFTVTFSDGGSVTEEVASAGVILPSRSAIADYTFVGWSETEITAEITNSPTIIPAGSYSPDVDITLYPVYSRVAYIPTEYSGSVLISDYATSNSWKNSTQYTSVVIDDNITATASTGQYTGSYVSSSSSWKIYQTDEGSVTITAATGFQLSSATFTFTKSNSGTLNYSSSALTSETAISLSGTSAEFTVAKTGSGTNGQILITKIEVEYVKPTTTYYTSTPVTTVDVIISTAEYATYSGARSLDFSETGITAYTATDGETKVTLNEITSGQVPANTPVVLYKAGADGTAINVPVIASADAPAGTNDLHVVGEGGLTGEDYIYVLAKKTTVGFYLWDSEKKLDEGKVYLQGKASYGARQYLGFGEETSIESLKARKAAEGKCYNLNGQRVAQPSKGLFIVDGKKVMVK